MDLSITFDNCVFSTHLFFKKSHSGTIQPYSSCVPNITKRAIVFGELRRAIFRSSSNHNTLLSLSMIFTRLMDNGYPKNFLFNTFRLYLHRNYFPNFNRIKQTHKKKKYIKIPFVNDSFCKKLNNIIFSVDLQDDFAFYFVSNVNLSFSFRPKKEHIFCNTECRLCPMAEKHDICNKKNIIYIITCSLCSKVYIDETKRFIKQRMLEHLARTFINIIILAIPRQTFLKFFYLT